MVCVGIDVAKDKHDCCILDSDGMVRADCFTIPNNMDGFKQLLQTIRNCTQKSDKIKVGLEVYIGQQHSCNRFCIHTIGFSFAKAETFSVQVGVQRIHDIDGQVLVKKKSKNVVAVMSGSLKSYFYFV